MSWPLLVPHLLVLALVRCVLPGGDPAAPMCLHVAASKRLSHGSGDREL